ncbi:hypothetical protein PSP6_150103 [Paraburkholderia tropica]|nr:hypothetical protein PSP6_150103 [Paraburkholderia tropica]
MTVAAGTGADGARAPQVLGSSDSDGVSLGFTVYRMYT